MSASNGLAASRVLDLGDLTPDTRPVGVWRDGRSVTLEMWVDGPRCPGYVKSNVSKARRIFRDAVYVDGPPDENGQSTRVFQDDDDEHWHAYLAEVLKAVIEDLAYAEAEILAGNQTLALDTLRAGQWVSGTAEDDAPEAPGEGASLTTAGSSPDSPGSTRASRRKRS